MAAISDPFDASSAAPHHPLWGSEGFEVRSAHGHLGLVESVHADDRSGQPAWLAVRAGRIIVLLVPVEEVVSVDPDEGLVTVGPYANRRVPDFLGDRILLRPREGSRPSASAERADRRGESVLGDSGRPLAGGSTGLEPEPK